MICRSFPLQTFPAGFEKFRISCFPIPDFEQRMVSFHCPAPRPATLRRSTSPRKRLSNTCNPHCNRSGARVRRARSALHARARNSSLISLEPDGFRA